MNFDFSKACALAYHNILLAELLRDELPKWTRWQSGKLVILSSQKSSNSDSNKKKQQLAVSS